MVLFFNLEFDARVMRLVPAVLLGALGFAALATLLAGISSRLRGGDLVLPLLAVPMFVPALIAGVKASALALSGAPVGEFARLAQGAGRLRRDVRRRRLPAVRIRGARGLRKRTDMNGRTVRLGVGLITLALMLAALYMVFVYVPTEAEQGIVQRIFYFHVPCAWVAFASFAPGGDRRGLLPVARPADMGRPGLRRGRDRDGLLHAGAGHRARSGPSRFGAHGGPGIRA